MNVNEWTGFNYPDELVEQAAAWLGFLDGQLKVGELNESFDILEKGLQHLPYDKRMEFFDWLGEDSRHQHVFVDCCELWAKTSCLKTFNPNVITDNILAFPKRTKTSYPIESVFNDSTTLSQAAPVWAYNLVLGLIVFGMSIPLFA